MPEIGENTHLTDLIGCDSLALLELLPFANVFLRELSKAWVGTKNCKIFQTGMEEMQCTRDVAERAVGMATGVHNLSSLP